MDYEPDDSSGTEDDDLPPSHQNRIPRGGHISGNGRSAVMESAAYPPRMQNKPDMEAQIHQLEQEAYSSVLRAFKAQADAITWEKESLITELRKELRLSNEEHRELLGRVNTDEVICRIREWRQSCVPQPGHDSVPNPSVSASRKKQKIAPPMPSQPFGGPSSSAAKRVHMTGSKGKKQKSYPSSGPTGRGHASSVDASTFNPLIGRRVRTRWPDDNNFYEAVITDYNAAEGLHALVYDMGTPNEAWEWVNIAEMSQEDIQWVDIEDRGMNRPVGRVVGAGRGFTKGHPKKGFPQSQNGVVKASPEDIKILNTDYLIKEVERIFSANQSDPLEFEKVTQMLKEQEEALADAITRLADISDGESDGGR